MSDGSEWVQHDYRPSFLSAGGRYSARNQPSDYKECLWAHSALTLVKSNPDTDSFLFQGTDGVRYWYDNALEKAWKAHGDWIYDSNMSSYPWKNVVNAEMELR